MLDWRFISRASTRLLCDAARQERISFRWGLMNTQTKFIHHGKIWSKISLNLFIFRPDHRVG